MILDQAEVFSSCGSKKILDRGGVKKRGCLWELVKRKARAGKREALGCEGIVHVPLQA